MGSSVVWWELGISTRLPFSTPMGQAFGRHPTASQYVDQFSLRSSIYPTHPSKPQVSHVEVACGRNPRAELED